MTAPEQAGEHLVPAASTRLWEALADPDTVARALPPGARVEWAAGRPVRLGLADGRLFDLGVTEAVPADTITIGIAAAVATTTTTTTDGRPSRAEAEPGEVVPAVLPAVAGEFAARLVPENALTRVVWRWSGPVDGASEAPVRAAVDEFLVRLGQLAAVPVTVAAEGLAGIASVVAETTAEAVTTPTAHGRGRALAPFLQRARAWPREVAVGGALFAVVLLIVVGIL